ncbi:MAG: superoxide dismutase family protein [Pseudobdellovibrio sp.]
MKILFFSLSILIGAEFAWSAPSNIVVTAHARLLSKSGSAAKGIFDFKETPLGLQIHYQLEGLPKNQTLGVHIHEIGDCSSPDAKSAGGHFDRIAETGGTSLDFPEKFAGDLPSIHSDASGKAVGDMFASGLGIISGRAVRGRSIIIHGGPDDVNDKSSPRIACGAINPNIVPK